MDWSQDFCLSCDNVNPTDGPYCSEACRLLDMDKSVDIECSHAAVYATSYSSRTSNWVASGSNRSSGFYLAPAVDFSALRTASLPAAAASLPGSPQSASHASYFLQASTPANPSTSTRPHHSHSSSRKSLVSSSSRSSLSSINASATSSSHGLSDQAISQLRNYLNSFDHTRDLRRRVTLA